MAKHLGVSSVVISQIFKGVKDLTIDQALAISELYTFDHFQQEYFMGLVSMNRAATHKLKRYYESKLLTLKEQALDLKSKAPEHSELDDMAKRKFYSDWSYSATRLACALDFIKTSDDVAQYLNLEPSVVNQRISFLKSHGLVAEQNGSLAIGIQSTHLSKRDPLIHSHRTNWRIKAIERMTAEREEDLFYAGPMALSEDSVAFIQQELRRLLSELGQKVPKDEPEELYCLNFDFFQI
jgi:uncharacterized protein (TIGR02147 family)